MKKVILVALLIVFASVVAATAGVQRTMLETDADYTTQTISASNDLTGSFYTVVDTAGRNYISIQHDISGTNADDGVEVTMWATNNPTASELTTTGWVDVSTTLLGSSSLTVTGTSSTGIKQHTTPYPARKYLIKRTIVADPAETSADLTNSTKIWIHQIN